MARNLCRTQVGPQERSGESMDRNRLKANMALLACNTVWALDYPFYKLLLPGFMSPLGLATCAVTVAAVISLLTLPFDRKVRMERRDILKFVGAALLTGVARKLLLMEGVARTSPIDGSIINTVAPVLVLVLSVLVHMDRFTPGKVLGVVMGMGGALAVILLSSKTAHSASDLRGNILILFDALSTAVYMVWFSGLMKKYGALTVIRWIYWIAAAVLLPIGAGEVVHTDFHAFTEPAMLAFLFAVLIPTFGPNLLLAYSLRHVAPTVSSMYSYVQPAVATVVAKAMGMDRLHWDTVIAALFIFGGVLLVIRSYNVNPSANAEVR